MLRRVVHVVASAYIYIACFGLLVVASDWLGGRKGESADGDYSAGLWPLPPEQESLLASSAVTNPGKPPLRIIQTNLAAVHAGEALLKPPPAMKVVQANLAAVHAGETLLKRPPAMKVVQANLAAVHAGETLLKRPPAMKVVQANLAAVHAGETLLKRPPAMKVVQANLAAVHAGEALLKPPPAMKVVQANLAAVHAGETPIKASPPALVTAAIPKSPPSQASPSRFVETSTAAIPEVPVPIRKPRIAPSSLLANPAKGASTNEQDMQSSKSLPKAAAQSDPHSINRKVGRKSVGPTVAEKRKSTTVKVTGAERPSGKDHRRMRMATTTTPAATMASRSGRGSDGNEVRRVVEQLNDEDRQAFRSRCGQILSAPGRFSRTHVAICTAASL